MTSDNTLITRIVDLANTTLKTRKTSLIKQQYHIDSEATPLDGVVESLNAQEKIKAGAVFRSAPSDTVIKMLYLKGTSQGIPIFLVARLITIDGLYGDMLSLSICHNKESKRVLEMSYNKEKIIFTVSNIQPSEDYYNRFMLVTHLSSLLKGIKDVKNLVFALTEISDAKTHAK